jgi:hypothetical protein
MHPVVHPHLTFCTAAPDCHVAGYQVLTTYSSTNNNGGNNNSGNNSTKGAAINAPMGIWLTLACIIGTSLFISKI